MEDVNMAAIVVFIIFFCYIYLFCMYEWIYDKA